MYDKDARQPSWWHSLTQWAFPSIYKLHLVAPEYCAGTPYHPSTPNLQGGCLYEVGRLIKYASSISEPSKQGNKPSLSARPSLWEGKERKEERETEAKTGSSLVPQLSSSFCSIKCLAALMLPPWWDANPLQGNSVVIQKFCFSPPNRAISVSTIQCHFEC